MATCQIIPERSGRTTHGPLGAGHAAAEVPHFLDPEQMRRPEFTVYLHTVSKRSFEQPHPIYRNLFIPACPADKRYITFMSIAHPVQCPTLDPDNPSGMPLVRIENGIRAALCVCNPGYAGTDLSIQDKEVEPGLQLASMESNLTRQGVFASLNKIPTEEELAKAEQRRVKYYRACFEEANTLHRSSPGKLQDVLGIDHHLAAEMFGEDTEWHRAVGPKVICPNCGEKIKEGLAFHFVNGMICVLNWERAWLANAVKKENVPEPMRWWDDGAVKRGPGRPPKVQEEV